jgi:hypothetical protein
MKCVRAFIKCERAAAAGGACGRSPTLSFRAHRSFDSDRRVDYELEEKQRRLNKLKELTEKKKNAGVE